MTSSEALPDLSDAFPEPHRSTARVVLSAVVPNLGAPGTRSPDDIGALTFDGHTLRVPARIYNPEPDWASVQSRSPIDESFVGCVYSRHHDGRVRERALSHIRTVDEPWVAPFVIQLLGEYVVEIAERAAAVIASPPRTAFVAFVRQNPGFLGLTTARATSYWNEYYRKGFPVSAEYPALIALASLRASLEAES